MRFANPFLHTIEIVYRFLIMIGSNLESLFLLYMRVTWGQQLMNRGWAKLHAIENTEEFFALVNISHSHFNAYMVGWFELIGGFCLFVGFASRIAAVPIAIIMLIALSTAHAPDISNFRYLLEPLSVAKQAPYPFLITAILIFTFGPGRISIDGWLKRWAEKRPKY